MINEENDSHAQLLESGKEEELESTKAKVGKVREENERLKLLLSKVLNDYNSLQTRVSHVLRDEQPSRAPSLQLDQECEIEQDCDHRVNISLCLGRSSESKKCNEHGENKSACENTRQDTNERLEEKKLKLGLGFGAVDSKLVLNIDSSQENEPPRKALKTLRNENGDQEEMGVEQNQQQELGVRKTRVCVRARCEGLGMNDGCQWRKYGQKTAKGNPLPRAYYRCTMSPNCPVRKQVQRAKEDESIWIMTYEGNHDHPLPMAATTMASATSAAACALQSCSSSSSPSTSLNASLGYLFPSHNFSISTSNSHPTITLDLTRPNYNHKLPNYPSPQSPYATSLSFSSFDSSANPLYGNTLSFNGFSMNTQTASQNTNSPTWLIASSPSVRTTSAVTSSHILASSHDSDNDT